jgi:lysozyme family protein
MVMSPPRLDPSVGAAGALGAQGAPSEAALAAQLQDALANMSAPQVAQALTALRGLDESKRNKVLEQLDPAALQVLMEAIALMVQGGQPFGGAEGAQGGQGAPVGGGSPLAGMGGAPASRASARGPGAMMGGMPGGMPGFSMPPALNGMTRAGAQPRHAPVTTRTPGLNAGDPAPAMRGAGKTPTQLREKHSGPAAAAQPRMTPAQTSDAAAFRRNFEQNRARYDAVAQKTNMPAELVAALHWRESSGNFNTYLHQGDPLGKPAVHVPRNIPVFHRWEDSAVHALGQKAGYQQALGLTRDSTDKGSMAAYAELYNGLGYHYRGRPSPYVYSGTDKYSSGKYVRDGVYDPNTVDRQLGVLALMQSLR